MLMMCLTACGGPTPTETVDSFLTAVKAQDSESIKTIYAEEDFEAFDMGEDSEDNLYGDLEETLMTKLLDFEYTLSNEQINEDKATVDVTFKTYELGKAMSSWITEYISQAFALAFGGASDEQLEKLAETILTDKIDDAEEKTFEKTVTVSLTDKDGAWVIDEFEEEGEFYNALTGGMIEAMNEIDEMW